MTEDAYVLDLKRDLAALEARLEVELSAEQRKLVARLLDVHGALQGADWTNTTDRLGEGLARHYGSQAPLVRVLWRHVWASQHEGDDECGLMADLRAQPARHTAAWCRSMAGD